MKMNKKRIMSFVLSLCMILSVISIQTAHVEAAPVGDIGYMATSGNNTVSLPTSAVNYIREDEISGDPQKIYAKWRNIYSTMANTRLELTFHLQDNITYVLSVENAKHADLDSTDSWNTPALAEIIKVTLKTISHDNTTSPPTSSHRVLTGLSMYDTRTQSNLSLASSAVTGDRRFKFAQVAGEDINTSAVFLLKASAGFSLTDDLNNKISFYWDNNTNFYVIADKVNGLPTDGRIFDLTLTGEDISVNAKPGNTNDFGPSTLYVCTGYADAVRAVPFAKGTDADLTKEYPGYQLDSTINPAVQPGIDTGIMLYVNFPRFWDKDSNSFKQRQANPNLNFLMKLNLMGTPATDITVPNIYADDTSPSYSQITPNLTESGAKKSDNGDSVIFTFSHLDPSTVFNTAYLQLSCTEDEKTLLTTDPIDLSAKSIFTYPEYKIAADGTDDFYIEITPFKYSNGRYISGNYTIYEIDFPTPPLLETQFYNHATFPSTGYKLETRYYKQDDAKPIITLNKNAKAEGSVKCWYFITFETETSPKSYLNSQFYRYQADAKDVRLGTPEIVEPIRNSVVSALDENYELHLTMDWKIGLLSVLDNAFNELDVNYVDYVFKRGYKSEKSSAIDDPLSNKDSSPFVALRITPSTINPDGYTIKLAPVEEYAYNEGIMLLTDADKSFYLKSMVVSNKSYDNAYGHIELQIPIYPVDMPGKPTESFYFPDTCLIEGYAVYDMKDPDDSIRTVYTGVSVRKIITINALDTMEVPTPQSFKVTPNSETKTSFQTTWLPVSTTDYENIEITPKQMILSDNSVTYNLYISTSKDNMTTLADFFRSDTSSKTTAAYGDTSVLPKDLRDFLPKIVDADVTDTPIASTSVLNFANTGAEGEIPITVSNGGTKQPGLKFLRDEKIIKISNLSQVDTEFVINYAGLDTNQVYYVMIETQVSPYSQEYTDTLPPTPVFDKDGLPVIIKDPGESPKYAETLIIEEKTNFSKYSVLLTVTTIPNDGSPDPSEIPPPSPTGVDKKDVTGNSATVFWNRMTALSIKDYNGMKYQILRIRGDQLPISMVNSNIPADKFIAQLETKLEPFIWQVKGESNVMTFDNTKFNLYDGGTLPSYEYVTTDKQHEFTDRSLKPNQLYMYYVRTITLVPDADADDPTKFTDDIYSHSVWVPVSVTTDPVHPPINLKIEQEKVTAPKTSTVISFDAPITKDKLGNSNYFGISITEEGVELPERVINSSADISALYNSASESTEKGYTHFQYTINGLKPGKSYIIKIRMYDITLGDWSPYSVTVRTRTEVDDEDYDYNSNLDKWGKHYISQIENLLKKPLWQISDTATSITHFVAEVRNSTFDAELQKSVDSVVLLGQNGNASQSYYIPLTAVQKANDAQKGFLISFGEQEVVIPKSTFDTATTKEIQNALKISANTDIFVKIDASVSQYNIPVDGTPPASPSITVTFSIIGTRNTEKQWDKDIYAQLEAYIKNESMISAFNALLGQQLQANATDEQLVKFVDQQVNNVKQTFITMTRNSFNGMVSNSYIVSVTDKPFIVKSTVDDTSAVGGYYYQYGSWLKQEQVSQYGNKTGIVNNMAGMYIFAGNKVVVPTINGLQNITELSGVYAKYGLNDYFGTDSVQVNAGNASVGTVTGVIAKIMGASGSDNSVDYLKSKGYQVQASNNTANIQTQQALYLLMALYEQKTNTKVDSLKIKNYNATANVTGIDPKYNKSILAAVDLGLIDGGDLQPRQAVLTSDFIKMLSQLAKKVKL